MPLRLGNNSRIKPATRLHLTNVKGLGAIRLLESFLPAFEVNKDVDVTEIYLPDSGFLAKHHPGCDTTITKIYKRLLPNALSRILECTVLSGRYGDDTPLIVFGDIPIRCKCRQIVFVQSTNLTKPENFRLTLDFLRYFMSRLIFKLNISCVDVFIVQTELMCASLLRSYPGIKQKVHGVGRSDLFAG